MVTAAEIAQYMIDTIRAGGRSRTYQSSIVRYIQANHGVEWTYINHNGNRAIDRRILTAFGPLKDEHVFWDRSDQSWRILDDDQLARMQEREARRKEQRAQQKARQEAWKAEQERMR